MKIFKIFILGNEIFANLKYKLNVIDKYYNSLYLHYIINSKMALTRRIEKKISK